MLAFKFSHAPMRPLTSTCHFHSGMASFSVEAMVRGYHVDRIPGLLLLVSNCQCEDDKRIDPFTGSCLFVLSVTLGILRVKV